VSGAVRHLLFTECLQNDFVAPVASGRPLPNALHIGRAESRRLLGDPDGEWTAEGPLARFLGAWRESAGSAHHSIHVRDWHDPADAATRGHLAHFGAHCLRGTEGARFVAPLEPIAETGIVVDSAIVSDFVGTDLEARLRPLVDGDVRAGIIGVWTDFKVQYLAYELMTRMGIEEIAVCGALTASRSRIHHRQALEHMAASLGVTVIDSLPEFLGWLGLGGAPLSAPTSPSARPQVECDGASLADEERRLVEHLFRDCRSVALRSLGGGFSGSRVYSSQSVDRLGKREVPFVVKVDSHARIARERVAVESVENVLGAASPRLAEYVDLDTLGAIKYHFATMHRGEVVTLQKAFRAAPDAAAAAGLFEELIARVLSRLYQSPAIDRLDLYGYYGYQPRYAQSTLERVDALAERRGGEVRVPGLDEALPDPRRFYEGLAGRKSEALDVACCWVHGDLNLANVLLDGTGNTWLIDYYWTRIGHALQDVAKLENDLKFLLVPLSDDEALARALAWERLLGSQDDMLAAPPALAAALSTDTALAKAHAAIVRLRELAADLLREAGLAGTVSADEYRIAQLRYSAHTLSFDECDERQKRFALVSTCLLADRLASA
jgi:nicotinamidase-related amidase/aminoglycoside phosphotransferase (APT) family kinase protein